MKFELPMSDALIGVFAGSALIAVMSYGYSAPIEEIDAAYSEIKLFRFDT